MKKITVFLLFAFLLSLLPACRTTDRTVSKQSTSQSDSLVQLTTQEGRVVDSTAAASFSEWWSQQLAQTIHYTSADELEQMFEEIATTTDSLGRTTRTERRATSRALNSQSALSSLTTSTDYSATLAMLNRRLDSLSRRDSLLLVSTKSNNISEQSVQQSADSTSFLSTAKALIWSLVVLVLCVALLFYSVDRYLKRKDGE